jgi:hypothetical protein
MTKAAVLLALGALGLAPTPLLARHAPVVVELFTAQGCASCNAADTLIGKLADRADVIALTWPVDYWDYLGWADTFAKPQFTDRQRAYERRLGLRDVYTPQIVVDGAAQVSGDDGAAVTDLVSKAADKPADKGAKRAGAAPQIVFLKAGRVAVGAARRPGAPAEVWLIRYDPKVRDVEVRAGDNRGAKVSETNVVREAIRLGRWSGRAVVFKAPGEDHDDLRAVVIVQQARGGPILAARRRPKAD